MLRFILLFGRLDLKNYVFLANAFTILFVGKLNKSREIKTRDERDPHVNQAFTSDNQKYKILQFQNK